MKNSNKYLNIIMLIFLPILSYSQDSPKQKEPKLKQLWTLAQVKEMAKKYNLQDSVVLKKYNFLLYTKKRSVEKYFQKEAKEIQIREEFKTYLSKTKNVRTYKDYENLLNSFPNVKQAIAQSQGGEVAFDKYLKESSKYTWRIYRNKDGGLGFYYANEAIDEEEANYAKRCQRIDNLPKTN